ncbi:MAG: HD domain-containing protein [Candidatus Adiutrix sp.]|jgi:putative nucleotidyltransferase with HDIG domain|nr:HD domain-containing protein [Candidatus Adiutrix sp.]
MNTSDVHALLPELSWIENADLRDRCADVWLEALLAGGWDEKGVEACPIVVKGLNPVCAYNNLDHIRSVTKIAAAICDELTRGQGEAGQLDRDAVIAGALLHDVGNYLEVEIGPDGRAFHKPLATLVVHPASGAFLLQKHGLPVEIVHIVLAHSDLFSPLGAQGCKTREAMIVKYADCLSFYHLHMHYGE